MIGQCRVASLKACQVHRSLFSKLNNYSLFGRSITSQILRKSKSFTRPDHASALRLGSISGPFIRLFSSEVSSVSSLPPLPPYITRTECGLYVDRSLPSNFKKILIANRGEIACRVIRTCKEIGVSTVAIYSDADVNAEHVKMADEAYRIGNPPAKESYLLGDEIIRICKMSGAQAVHPGYGFLSENAPFAALCFDNGIEFIGPPSSAIIAMGSKSQSKIIMTNANVPVVPGYHGEDQSVERLVEESANVGFPLMIKAVSGGGGKGMRIVFNQSDFIESLEACKREAMNSFKSDDVLLERYIVRPRHIEFQIFADKHGNAVHLFERDCSVQRRHQKVLEEAPAPGMTKELRDEMGLAAVNAAKAVGYVGAGTVEFIFDAETDKYYFMEMNTRLQVEHPVTEMIMRRDLVQWQLHVAKGFKLPVQQSDLQSYGNAIEARIYAEDPHNNFLPCTGRLIHIRAPEPSLTVRVETGVKQGDAVSIFYDPMISKLVCWGPTRDAALDKMRACLEEYQIVGPPVNIPFVHRAVQHPQFRKGQVETGFIKDNLAELLPRGQANRSLNNSSFAAAIAFLIADSKRASLSSALSSSDPYSPWAELNSFRVNTKAPRSILLSQVIYGDEVGSLEEIKHEATVIDNSSNNGMEQSYQINFGSHHLNVGSVKLSQEDSTKISCTVNGEFVNANIVLHGADVTVFTKGSTYLYRVPTLNFSASEGSAGGAVSPMAGKIVKVNVKSGDSVSKGSPLVIMEAMKMEHVIRAPKEAIVDKIIYQMGEFVEGGKLLVTFK